MSTNFIDDYFVGDFVHVFEIKQIKFRISSILLFWQTIEHCELKKTPPKFRKESFQGSKVYFDIVHANIINSKNVSILCHSFFFEKYVSHEMIFLHSLALSQDFLFYLGRLNVICVRSKLRNFNVMTVFRQNTANLPPQPTINGDSSNKLRIRKKQWNCTTKKSRRNVLLTSTLLFLMLAAISVALIILAKKIGSVEPQNDNISEISVANWTDGDTSTVSRHSIDSPVLISNFI